MDQEEDADRFLEALTYGFGWLSAIYFINTPRRAIRWHALQSLIVFGSLMLSIIVADSIFPLDSGNALVYMAHVVSMGGLIFISMALWVLLPLQTFRGKPFVVPVFAPLTKKWAGEPPWLNQAAVPPASPAPVAPTFCPKCGANWIVGAAACSSCGTTLS